MRACNPLHIIQQRISGGLCALVVQIGTCLQAYAFPIHPLNDPSQWSPSGNVILRAPFFESKKSGPKQTKRRLEAWELERKKKDKNRKKITVMTKVGQKGKCSICKQFGHNKRKHDKEVCAYIIFLSIEDTSIII
ncbi:hypothetical protein LINPERHAP2_LOCUS38626 [Linum perenne]